MVEFHLILNLTKCCLEVSKAMDGTTMLDLANIVDMLRQQRKGLCILRIVFILFILKLNSEGVAMSHDVGGHGP
jgi:hypothetical protein